MSWYFEVLKKYADFSGRARRKEFWMFALVNFIIMIVLAVLMAISTAVNGQQASGLTYLLMIIFGVYYLAVLVPSIAVAVRRLHDTNKSGWWLLAGIIPIVNSIGGIVLLVFYCLDSEAGPNKWGPNPKGVQAASTTATASA